jgi:PAS domain S-box-containing protein
VVDQQGTIRYWNPGAERVYGYTEHEILGQSIHVLMPHPYRERFLERAAHGGLDVEAMHPGRFVELPGLRRDGREIPLELSASSWQTGEGVFYGTTVRDISKHKQAEAILAQQRDLLDGLFENVPVGIAVLSPSGEIVRANRGCTEITGYTRDEIASLPEGLLSVFPNPAYRQMMLARWQELFQRETGPVTLEYQIVARDGTAKNVEFRSVRLADGRLLTSMFDVSERRRSEEALKAERTLLRTLVDHLPVAVYVKDAHGRKTLANTIDVAAMRAASESDILGKTDFDFYPPELAAAFHADDQRVITTGQPILNREEAIRRADGSRGWALTSKLPLHDRDGYVTGLVGIGLDITERKRAEEALRDSEARLQMAKAAADLGIYDHDALSDNIQWDQRVRELWGVGPSEPINYDVFLAGVHVDDRAGMQAALDRALDPAGDGRYYAEYRVCSRHDQSERWIAAMGQVFFAGGCAVRAVGTVQDITERKLREETLWLYKTVIESSTEAIAISNPAGNLLYINPAHETLFGRSLDQARGANYRDYYPAESVEVLDRLVAPALARGESWAGELDVFDSSGRRFPLWERADTVLDANGVMRYGFGFMHDITERKRTEETLRRAHDELARSNAELEQFAYVISHDLQQPLRTVAGFTQLLDEHMVGRLDTDAREYMGFIVDGARRMQQLISDLLNYARVGSRGASLQPTDATAALLDALWSLTLDVEEAGAAVTYDALPMVTADATQLTELFQNLIGNAIKFRGAEPPQIHIGVQREGNCWRFSVRDNGIGIDPQHFGRIFGIFQRLHTNEAYPGTGIGLAVCQRIVERHGGRIWVESAPSQGATFYFTLPA